jgi:hypothetical protein
MTAGPGTDRPAAMIRSGTHPDEWRIKGLGQMIGRRIAVRPPELERHANRLGGTAAFDSVAGRPTYRSRVAMASAGLALGVGFKRIR